MMRPTPDILAQAGQGDVDAMAAAMGPQVMALDISAVRLDGGTQPRAGINQAVVADYASDMEANGAEFPPVQVVYDGTDYWLWDGFHRLHARQRIGMHTVPAIVRQGTRRDAVLLSVGANATHGFRRTAEDKRRAVDVLLRDTEWAAWSDREIARRVGVDHKTVGARRAALSGEIPQIEERRAERGGTEYVMQPAKRAAGAAGAAQSAKEMTLDELEIAVQEWAKAFEDGEDAVQRLLDDINQQGGGEMLEDWQNSTGATRRTGLLLRTAALGVLARMERMAGLRALKEREDARWEQEQEAYRAAQEKQEQAKLTAWTAEELAEEFLSLEGVSLAGVDEDWLYDYVTDRVKRQGHSITRPVFDTAMRLATPRQVAMLQRQDRMERAVSAAQAADAERRQREDALGEQLQRWSENAGGQAALNELLAEIGDPGFPMTGGFPRWTEFKAWHGDGGSLSILTVREVLRRMGAGGVVVVYATTPAERTVAPEAPDRGMEFERKQINRGRTIKLYGRNVDGTLTVTVNAATVHLYSPGITLSRDDAMILTRMITDAQQELFDPAALRLPVPMPPEWYEAWEGGAR